MPQYSQQWVSCDNTSRTSATRFCADCLTSRNMPHFLHHLRIERNLNLSKPTLHPTKNLPHTHTFFHQNNIVPFPANFVTSVKLPISVTLQAKSGHRRAAAKETALEEAELRGLLQPFLGQVASVRQVRAVAAPGPRALAAREQHQESRHVVAPEATRFGQVWGETPEKRGQCRGFPTDPWATWGKNGENLRFFPDLRLLKVAICIKKGTLGRGTASTHDNQCGGSTNRKCGNSQDAGDTGPQNTKTCFRSG